MSRVRKVIAFFPAVCSLAALACDGREQSAPAASVSALTSGAPLAPSAPDFGSIERTRNAQAALDALARPLPGAERRAAARALARTGGVTARPRLLELLSDEDPVVVSYAALAVGDDCGEKKTEIETALLVRATALSAELGATPKNASELLGARRALALALGRCGSPTAENALRSWLTGPSALAIDGAFGLGQLAASQGKLSDRSSVALLDSVKKLDSEAPLFAFTRLSTLSPAVQTRLLDVTGDVLTGKASARRSFAVRSLGAAGFAAAAPLGRVLASDKFSTEERAAAAFALGRLGRTGQEELAAALGAFVESKRAWSERAPDFAALSATLSALTDAETAAQELAALSRLEIPKDASAWQKRRIVRIRCRAAALTQKPAPQKLSNELLDCDPEHGSVGGLALVSVLDQGKIEGARLGRFEALSKSELGPVRQAALRLLGAHPEVPGSAARLTAALESPSPGLVTTAAQILASYPARAETTRKDKASGVDPALAKALSAVFEQKALAQSIETLAAATDAVGALGLLNHKGAVERLCQSPHIELRRHAARSLALLGDPKQKCERPAPFPDPTGSKRAALRLVLETETGELAITLDEEAAPAAARRVSELARAGYYDGVAVHRFVEGFVTQLGDPAGDGFGDGKHAPLPDERSPTEFAPLDVGMAAFGKDTATTQFFVALARYPQLDGAYTRLGHAEGAWAELVPGDVVKKVRVVER